MTLHDQLREARTYAIESHGDQLYGDAPYVTHLDAVLAIAQEFGLTDPDILVACVLHDVIEDTDQTHEAVAARFGERVAAMVDAVSDPPGHPNRKSRKSAAYPRIRATPGATEVKLCDRLANARSSVADHPGLLSMYRKEHPGFREALHPGDGIDAPQAALWEAVDALLRG